MDYFLEKKPKKHGDAALATAYMQQRFPGRGGAARLNINHVTSRTIPLLLYQLYYLSTATQARPRASRADLLNGPGELEIDFTFPKGWPAAARALRACTCRQLLDQTRAARALDLLPREAPPQIWLSVSEVRSRLASVLYAS